MPCTCCLVYVCRWRCWLFWACFSEVASCVSCLSATDYTVAESNTFLVTLKVFQAEGLVGSGLGETCARPAQLIF